MSGADPTNRAKPRVRQAVLISVIAGAGILGVATLFLPQGAGPSSWHTRSSPDAGTAASAPYTVELSPAGKVSFTNIPERVVTMDANYNDMLVAVRQEQKLVATGYRDNFHDELYDAVPGLKVRHDPARMTYLSAPGGGLFDKELLYTLHADVHHIDPLQLASSRGWSKADVEEIARNVGPFIANRSSRENNFSGTEPYRYYDIWELSGKIAEVYQRPESILRLREIHREMTAAIHAKLPPESQRPRVGLVYYNTGKFTIYTLSNAGFGQAHYRDVGARDAFAAAAGRAYGGSSGPVGTPLDAEGLLSMNPDVLIMPFAIYPGAAHAAFDQMVALKNDPLLQRVNAFRDNRVYPGGTPLQGPIFYLFQIEMAAKQIYPEIFGSFRADMAYPVSEQLFDRGRLSQILGTGAATDHGHH